MAYDRFASDLAATFYAASLLPDPTLDTKQRPRAMDAYRTKGAELADLVLAPSLKALIRCACGTRTVHPDRPSRAIAAVHDHALLLVQGPRGPLYDGQRLQEHYIVDLGIARRAGFTSAAVWCYGCGALHELGFGWLKRARRNEISTPSEQYQIAPWGTPIAPQGYTPRHPNDANRLAFAITTGPLDSDVTVTLGWPYAFAYRDHFGFQPPHAQHLLRLSHLGNPRLQDPHIELLPPQWWRLQHDPERLAEERIDGPVPTEAIEGLVRFLGTLDTAEREDELLTLEQLMDRPDFDRLQSLAAEEVQ